MMNGRHRFPFTPSQWQELEHQALIFKFIASGIPIPPDLLFIIKRRSLDSPLSSRLLSHQPQHCRWNYLPMGLGRKIDPEPGRCRRTDGKKWRCSKGAYPNSKYCERHMHRGNNRMRKPLECLKTTPTNTNSSTPTISSITKSSRTLSLTTHSSLSPLSLVSSDQTHHHHPQHSCYGSHLQHSFVCQNQPSRSSGIGLSFQEDSAPWLLDAGSYHQANTDCSNRSVYGLKEDVDEHAFFTEPSGTMRSFSASSMDDSWHLTPLTMNSSSSSKQRSCFRLSNECSYLQLQSLSDNAKQPEQDHGCYMPGLGKEPQKTVHRFLDEWPPKNTHSLLDLDDKSSTTQLSISIPTSAHDHFPTLNSRTHRDA